MEYKRLGDYISEVNVRNENASITNLLGVNLSKKFIPSVANIIGTDLSNYKVIQKGQFGCKLMSIGRDGILPISFKRDNEPAIISSAYYVFEVNDEKELSSEYLMLCFLRPEFDRQLAFYSGGDVRGGVSFDDFCNMPIPFPDIDEQRRIVAEYQTIEKRIENNNRLIRKLEDTAKTIYHHTFVENLDPDNLPEGWKMGTIGEFCKETKSGGTPSRNEQSYWDSNDIPWLKSGEVHNNVITHTEEYISESGLKNSSAKIIDKGAVIMAMYGATAAQIAYLNCAVSTNQACCNMICNSDEDAAYLYFHLLVNQENIKRLANGGAQDNLSQDLICQQIIIMPNDNRLKAQFIPPLKYIIELYRENDILEEMHRLLLAKLA